MNWPCGDASDTKVSPMPVRVMFGLYLIGARVFRFAQGFSQEILLPNRDTNISRAPTSQTVRQPPKMAPPAVKRRKLSHDSDAESSDGGVEVGAVGSGSDVESDDGDSGSAVSDEDVDMGDVAQEEESEDGEDEEEVQSQAKAQNGKSQEKPQKSKTEPRKPKRDVDMAEMTGAYTGEVYKSNMFKLQVDELLAQVRPKHGKKEVAAEKALRELKSIIEKIPAREPSTVSGA